MIWLDLDEPTERDLQIVVEELGLHPLAVEDAITPHQRPKVDRYRTHLFVNMYAVAVDEHHAVRAGELSVFITPQALITVRKDDFDIDALIAHWDLNADLVLPPGTPRAFALYAYRARGPAQPASAHLAGTTVPGRVPAAEPGHELQDPGERVRR